MHHQPPYRCFVVLAVVWTSLLSCKKMVEVPAPPTGLTSENIYTDDATAASVLTAIYTSMASNGQLVSDFNLKQLSLLGSLSADELTLFGGASSPHAVFVRYYQNQLLAGAANVRPTTIWVTVYSHIYIVNLALERLTASTTLTPVVKSQLLGEAHFLRAFYYFYLVNLYGAVPLAVTSDYRINNELRRADISAVYEQIAADLVQAKTLLRDNYVAADANSSATDRARPNKSAAASMLARVQLFRGQWAAAETEASQVIQNSLYDTVSLVNTFKKESRETIWQLQPVDQGWNTSDARLFILPPGGPNVSTSNPSPVYLSTSLVNLFEPADQRRTQWTGQVTVNTTTYTYPWKYKSATLNAPVTEYTVVLRLAEQFLIRAEARARQNNLPGAKDDLNLIRRRAGLANTPANTQEELLTAIYKERQMELFTEWGHRWLDLKRTGKINEVMNPAAPQKGTSWNPNWQWWPLPAYDIFQNPNLTQNEGY